MEETYSGFVVKTSGRFATLGVAAESTMNVSCVLLKVSSRKMDGVVMCMVRMPPRYIAMIYDLRNVGTDNIVRKAAPSPLHAE